MVIAHLLKIAIQIHHIDPHPHGLFLVREIFARRLDPCLAIMCSRSFPSGFSIRLRSRLPVEGQLVSVFLYGYIDLRLARLRLAMITMAAFPFAIRNLVDIVYCIGALQR